MGLNNTKLILGLCSLIFLASCSKKEPVEFHISNKYTGVTKIDLPRIKNKLLTWEVIKDFFSSFGENKKQLDLPVDLSRPAYLCHSQLFDTVTIFLPINEAQQFFETLKKVPQKKHQKLGEYNYTETPLFFRELKHVYWSNNVAIISNQKLALKNYHDQVISNTSVKDLLNTTDDVSGLLATPNPKSPNARVSFQSNFENGEINIKIDADSLSKNYLLNKYLCRKELNAFSFTTDSCILGLSAKVKPELLDDYTPYVLPYLQQYGLLFDDQYKNLRPFFDGRMYLGLSKLKIGQGLLPEGKIAFGMIKEYKKALDSTTLKNFSKQQGTDYLVDQEGFQYVLPKDDYIIFSNDYKTKSIQKDIGSLFRLQINQELINDDLLTLPRSYFGSTTVDNFPFTNISFDMFEKSSRIESNITITCKNKTKNSLATLIDYVKLIKNKEEI